MSEKDLPREASMRDGHDTHNGHNANGNGSVNGLPAVRRKPRWHGYTAFVLSGGGARGALQAGALKALLEHGERPDVVVGTSIGAWNAAWVARAPALEGVEQLIAAWRSITASRVLLDRDPPPNAPVQAVAGVRLISVARRLTRGHPSLYGDAGLRHLVNTYLAGETFEAMRIPLRIIAADITHGRREIFTSGPVVPAVLASSAIPGVFPPVHIGDAVYVDGGALDNASIETALALGARRIFVLDVGYDETGAGEALWSDETLPAATRARGLAASGAHPLAAVLERTVQVMSRYQLDRALQRVPRGVECYVIRPGTGEGGGALEFDKAPAWIDRGYEAAQEYLRAHVPRTAQVEIPA